MHAHTDPWSGIQDVSCQRVCEHRRHVNNQPHASQWECCTPLTVFINGTALGVVQLCDGHAAQAVQSPGVNGPHNMLAVLLTNDGLACVHGYHVFGPRLLLQPLLDVYAEGHGLLAGGKGDLE